METHALHCNSLLLLLFDIRRYVCLLSHLCPLLYGKSSIEIHVYHTPYYFSCQECFTFSNFCISNSRHFWLELSLWKYTDPRFDNFDQVYLKRMNSLSVISGPIPVIHCSAFFPLQIEVGDTYPGLFSLDCGFLKRIINKLFAAAFSNNVEGNFIECNTLLILW